MKKFEKKILTIVPCMLSCIMLNFLLKNCRQNAGLDVSMEEGTENQCTTVAVRYNHGLIPSPIRLTFGSFARVGEYWLLPNGKSISPTDLAFDKIMSDYEVRGINEN